MGFLFQTWWGIAITVASVLVIAIVTFGIAITILAFSNGPGACTPGGDIILVNAANADTFDQKWDALDAALDGGSPSSATFNEIEISSRADQYFRKEKALDFGDVRVCIYDGYG